MLEDKKLERLEFAKDMLEMAVLLSTEIIVGATFNRMLEVDKMGKIKQFTFRIVGAGVSAAVASSVAQFVGKKFDDLFIKPKCEELESAESKTEA